VFTQEIIVSTPNSQVLRATRCTIQKIILLIWVGLPAAIGLQAGSPPLQASAPQNAQESNSLELGKPVERELSHGHAHSYKIMLTSGQYLQIVVKQRGIDVAVAIFTPESKKIGDVDSEHMVEGSEIFSLIAEVTGSYLIEVRSPEKSAKGGRYEIVLEVLRAATREDKDRVAAGSIFREAERLQNGTLEERRKSIEKYYEALELYRKAGDRYWEGEALNNIGEVYWLLGDVQKGLEKFNEALPVRQAVDPKGGAETLNNIGLVYWSLGDMRTALEKYNGALPIRQAAGDRNGEAETLHNIGLVYWYKGRWKITMRLCLSAGQ
jgi:hypothetical protein